MSPNRSNSFELIVLRVICIVGLTRAIMEFYRNTSESGVTDFYLDVGYAVIFIITAFLVFLYPSYRLLVFFFYVPLIILLSLTLYDRGGLASSTENNIYAGLLVITLTMKGRDSIWYSTLLIVAALLSLYLVHINLDFSQLEYSQSTFNFTYMSVMTILVTFYAKHIFEKRKRELIKTKQSLTDTYNEIAVRNQQLEEQNKELSELNKHLEVEVEKRINKLNDQRFAMKEYLDITLNELKDSYQQAKDSLQSVETTEHSELSKMIVESAHQLNNELTQLEEKITNEKGA